MRQPDIDGTERGFDFLGYHFGPEGLAIAQKTLYNFVERAIRIYEQGPEEPCDSTRLGEYIQRWVRWAGAGLGNAGPYALMCGAASRVHADGCLWPRDYLHCFTKGSPAARRLDLQIQIIK